MKKLSLFMLAVLTFQLVISNASAVTSVVDVMQLMDWNVVSFSASDVTYPSMVYFTLDYENNGTADTNVSGNLTITKDSNHVHTEFVFQDNVSALNQNNFSFNWTPTDTGDFLANLTINVSNEEIPQSNITYSVTSFTVYSQPAGPGGGSSGTYTPPPPFTNVSSEWDEILPDVPVTIEIDRETYAITSISIEVNTKSTDVVIEITSVGEKPSHVTPDPPGKVYKYIEITHSNIQGKVKKAVMKFKVEKDWLSENGIEKRRVIINRFNEETGKWDSYSATVTGEDSDYVYYTSEVPDLSVFSISGSEDLLCEPGDKKCGLGKLEECSTLGIWETLETCEHGCADDASCKIIIPPCVAGERRCSGDTLQSCKEDGSGWEDLETCEYGCWDNECKEMLVSLLTRIAVAVMFIILGAIVLIIIGLAYINIRSSISKKSS